jgi:hypothetical protein
MNTVKAFSLKALRARATTAYTHIKGKAEASMKATEAVLSGSAASARSTVSGMRESKEDDGRHSGVPTSTSSTSSTSTATATTTSIATPTSTPTATSTTLATSPHVFDALGEDQVYAIAELLGPVALCHLLASCKFVREWALHNEQAVNRLWASFIAHEFPAPVAAPALSAYRAALHGALHGGGNEPGSSVAAPDLRVQYLTIHENQLNIELASAAATGKIADRLAATTTGMRLVGAGTGLVR